MKVSELFTREDAIAPVIGVVLMVGITVILASIVGAFVLTDPGGTEDPPDVRFGFEGDAQELEVLHTRGDNFRAGNVRFAGEVADPPTPWHDVAPGVDEDDRVRAGDSVTLEEVQVGQTDSSKMLRSDGGELLLVWSPQDSQQSNTIGIHDVDPA